MVFVRRMLAAREEVRPEEDFVSSHFESGVCAGSTLAEVLLLLSFEHHAPNTMA
jgi:hypothetical protein